jgi:hypothetical protein
MTTHNGCLKCLNITLLACILNIIVVPVIIIITGYIPEIEFVELTIISIAILTSLSLIFASCEMFKTKIPPIHIIGFQILQFLIYCSILILEGIKYQHNMNNLWSASCVLSIFASILLSINIYLIEKYRSSIDTIENMPI